MAMQRKRWGWWRLGVPLGALVLTAVACSDGASDEDYAELQNRVEFVERELGEVTERVEVLEGEAGTGG